jgi:cell division protein FtsL
VQPLPVIVGGALARPLLAIKTLPDNRLLDRIVRGRSWIPVLGVLLVAIVATQVEVLKVGQVVGNSTALASQLSARNGSLRNELADLSSPSRIERLATQLGMHTTGPTNVIFLTSGGRGSVGRAIAGITPPTVGAFAPLLSTSAGSNTLTTSPGGSDPTTSLNNTDVSSDPTGGSSDTTGGDGAAGTSPAGTTGTGAGSTTNTTSSGGTSTGGAGI